MRICFAGPANNYHIRKWCAWFTAHAHEVHVISFIDAQIPGVEVHYIQAGVSAAGSDVSKLRYLLHSKEIKRIVDTIKPDIVNVHFATSYGTAAALSGLKGYVLSVWGSDVYAFPNKSPLHKAMLKFSLKRASFLLSTSNSMAAEAGKYTDKKFYITPFGVDMELFNPSKRFRNDRRFVIGTVKALEDKYGISYLLKAAAILRKSIPELELRIAGKGTKEAEYKRLAAELHVDDITRWLGFIPQDEAAAEWANMDVGIVYSSDNESFGVSVIEAEASGIPVIVSNVPGLLETTQNGSMGVVVERNNEKLLAAAVMGLYEDPSKRAELGKQGRLLVEQQYELNHCFRYIEGIYADMLSGKQD